MSSSFASKGSTDRKQSFARYPLKSVTTARQKNNNRVFSFARNHKSGFLRNHNSEHGLNVFDALVLLTAASSAGCTHTGWCRCCTASSLQASRSSSDAVAMTPRAAL